MILTFGCYKGQDLADIAEKDRGYVKWVCKYCRYPEFKQAAADLLTDEETERCRECAHSYRSKFAKTIWFIHFIKSVLSTSTPNSFKSRFCLDMLSRIRDEHRLDKFTYNQIKVLARMWGEYHGGREGTDEFRAAVLRFAKRMKPFWDSNHSKEMPIDAKGDIRR